MKLKGDCKYFKTKEGILTVEAKETFEVGYEVVVDEKGFSLTCILEVTLSGFVYD